MLLDKDLPAAYFFRTCAMPELERHWPPSETSRVADLRARAGCHSLGCKRV
jgi:hypothetical protein